MPIIRLDDVPTGPFRGDATCQTLGGGDAGASPACTLSRLRGDDA
jgi:hypothetical protein